MRTVPSDSTPHCGRLFSARSGMGTALLMGCALLLVALVACVVGACREADDEFSGLVGRVALGPVEGAVVSIYDASLFAGLESDAGLLATAVTNASGNFRAAVPDASIGRSLIVVARFVEDDDATADVDERARYLDFSDTPQSVLLDPADGPWVSMVPFFHGLEVQVAVTPWTTVAFGALASHSASAVGVGSTRYTNENIDAFGRMLGVNLGMYDNPLTTRPERPDFAGTAHQGDTSAVTSTTAARLALLSLIQLDRAAEAYALQTADADDSRMDFIRALQVDACDGVVDGKSHGAVLALFDTENNPAAAGAPDVVGVDAVGASKLLVWIAEHADIPDAWRDELETGESSLDLEQVEAMQALATGAIGMVTVQRIDDSVSRAIPRMGGASMTLYGRGFTRPLSIVLSPRYQNSSAMGRETLTIDENSSGAAGEILYADAERVEFRMPDLSGEDVASAFEIPASVRYSRLNAFVRCRYAQSSTGRRADRFAGVLTQVVNDGLQLLSVRVVKLGSPGTVGGVVAFGHAETDPALLDPEAEAVYALELEVYNGGDTQLAGIQLDLERTEAEYAGATITATAFGDEVVAELIFAPAQSDGASADLEPGAFATLEVRFVIREASLDAGDELVLVPVVVGTSDQGVVFSDDSERTPPVTVAVVVADDASTPLLVDQAPEDEVWEEGTGISLRWPLQSLAQGDGAVRSAHLVALELRVTPAGQSPFFVRAEGPIFSMPESPNAIRLVSVTLENGTAKEELPFLMLGDEVEVVLALEADEGFIGEVEIELGAVMRESLTGVETTVTRTVQTEVMP